MLKKYKFDKNIRHMIFVMMLVFGCMVYNINRIYGFELLPDEFGYWTYSAALSGYDWSDIVSLGSYYSFGYTLILYPLFCLFEDSMTVYRAAASFNYILIAAAFLALVSLMKRVDKNKTYYIFFAAAAVFYPPLMYYARITMTEAVVACMYVFICLLFYIYIENKKPMVLAVLVLSLVYIYTVHMRTVGIVIAAAFTLLIMQFGKIRERDKGGVVKVVLFTMAVIILIMAANEVKNYISENIYSNEAQSMIKYNDYSGQAEKIRNVFSGSGFRNLFVSIIGKILYLGLSSFGLFYMGIKKCLDKLASEKNQFYLFVLMSAAGEIIITSVYTSGFDGRIDSLTYGRYNEHILPVFMALGCIAVMEAEDIVKTSLRIVGIQLPMLGLIIYVIKERGMTGIHAYMVSGISYFFDEETFEPVSYHVTAYIVAMVLMAVVTFLVRMSKKRKMEILIFGVIFIELLLGMRLEKTFAEETQLANYRDIQLADIIMEEKKEHERLVFVQEGDRCMADSLQFILRGEKIILERDKKSLKNNDLVVTDYLYSEINTLKTEYENWRIMGHFAVFYN